MGRARRPLREESAGEVRPNRAPRSAVQGTFFIVTRDPCATDLLWPVALSDGGDGPCGIPPARRNEKKREAMSSLRGKSR